LLFNTKRQVPGYEELRLALGIWVGLAADFPTVPAYRSRLASSHYNMAVFLDDNGRLPEAEASYGEARKLLENLVTSFPDVTEYRRVLGAILNNLVSFRLSRHELVEARQLVEKAIEHQRIVLKSNEHDAVSRQFLGNHYRTFTEILVQAGEHAQAV